MWVWTQQCWDRQCEGQQRESLAAQLERLWGTGWDPCPGHANGNAEWFHSLCMSRHWNRREIMMWWLTGNCFGKAKQGLNLELFQGKNKGTAFVHAAGAGCGQGSGPWHRWIWPWFLPCRCVTLPRQCLPPNKMWVLTQTCFYVLLSLY